MALSFVFFPSRIKFFFVVQYYVDPSGRKFRSKKDVYHYLETGSIRKKKLIETPVAYITVVSFPSLSLFCGFADIGHGELRVD